MGMQIVTKSYVEEIVERYHDFDYADMPGAGFAFEMNAEGEYLKLNPTAAESLRLCLTGTVNGRKVIDRGVTENRRRYRHPAEGKCDCGHVLMLAEFTNTCERCGRDYNGSGQRLAPRSQWGEDTGESLGDILNIGHYVG